VHSNSGEGHLPLLHIDDGADDRLLVSEAIILSNTPFDFYQANGMESAIPYFQSTRHDGELKKHPHPALVLLDYNLGDHTGADFLYWMRLMKKINSTPVVMFSASNEKRIIAECYATGANHFLCKPLGIERVKTIVRTLHLSLVSHTTRPSPILHLPEYQPDPRKGSPV